MCSFVDASPAMHQNTKVCCSVYTCRGQTNCLYKIGRCLGSKCFSRSTQPLMKRSAGSSGGQRPCHDLFMQTRQCLYVLIKRIWRVNLLEETLACYRVWASANSHVQQLNVLINHRSLTNGMLTTTLATCLKWSASTNYEVVEKTAHLDNTVSRKNGTPSRRWIERPQRR